VYQFLWLQGKVNVDSCFLVSLLFAAKNPMSAFVQSEADLAASAAAAALSEYLPERCILIITDTMASDLVFAPLDQLYMVKLDHQDGSVKVSPVSKGVTRSGFSKSSAAAFGVPVFQAVLQGLQLTTPDGISASALKEHLYAVFRWNLAYKPWAVIVWAGSKDAHSFDQSSTEDRFGTGYVLEVSVFCYARLVTNVVCC
jgi:hypothetical protein